MQFSHFYRIRSSDAKEMVKWAEDNIGPENGRWWWQANVLQTHIDKDWPTSATVFTFDYEEDAVMFELRWRGAHDHVRN